MLTAAAYVLMQELRLCATGTTFARAQVTTLRERLLKLGAWFECSVRRVVLHLPRFCTMALGMVPRGALARSGTQLSTAFLPCSSSPGAPGAGTVRRIGPTNRLPGVNRDTSYRLGPTDLVSAAFIT